MTDKDYEQKKREFKKKMLAELFKTKKALVNYENDIFNYTFDRAYILGREKETITQEEIVDAAKKYDNEHAYYNSNDVIECFVEGANFALGKQEKDAEKQEVLTCEKSKVLYRFRMAEACKIGNNPESDYWIGYSKAIKDLFGLEGEPCVTPNDADTVIRGWVARDVDGNLFMYCTKPERDENLQAWIGRCADFDLRNSLFPDLTWSDNPQEVEIIIKRKKNG